MNSLGFLNEFTRIQLNLSTDSNFLKISLIFIIWIFWGNHQWIKKWIHWIKSKTEKFFLIYFFWFLLVFSNVTKLFIKFLKSESLSWIFNSFCYSRNEFTNEFIDLNLIIFCDKQTNRQMKGHLCFLSLLMFQIARLKINNQI